MRIASTVRSSATAHDVSVATQGNARAIPIPSKYGGGSAVNGGEFLMLALATCYCNDIYREAAKLGVEVDSIEVEASADFEGIGLAATNITYRARVRSSASPREIEALLRHTDAVAEVHNTVRTGAPVVLLPWDE
jgi:organic hydroperoxide reductase OsmC/OhrA